MKKKITVNDKMQSNYVYYLTEKPGKNFHPDFKPEITPAAMLECGVFEGKYMNDCFNEFPAEWFEKAKIVTSESSANPKLNLFKIKSRMSLAVWRSKGWIYGNDPRGWFQWYCRYWMGRRDPEVDIKQIKRWKSFKRHVSQVKKNCEHTDIHCRPKQRQALLQWAYNPFP